MKKQVAVFRNNFLPYSETFIHDELRFHDRYEATVFANKWTNKDYFPGHNVICLEQEGGHKKLVESFLYKKFIKSWTFDKSFNSKKFDVIHAHFGFNGIYALPFSKRHKIPLIVSLHGHDVTILLGTEKKSKKWKKYVNNSTQLFEHCSLFLAASSDLRELIIEAGCPSNKVVVNLLGIDISKFKPQSQKQLGIKKVVMIGRLVEKKGFEYGIKAFAKALRNGIDAEMLIAGDGPLRNYLVNISETEGIKNKVFFLGSIPHHEIVNIICKASVLLAPSVVAVNLDRDSGLIVAKEASACEIPVIGSLHGGIPDIIDDGKTGFLVKEKDVDHIADCLNKLLTDDTLRSSLGKQARIKMENEYDIVKRNIILENIYDRVIQGK